MHIGHLYGLCTSELKFSCLQSKLFNCWATSSDPLTEILYVLFNIFFFSMPPSPWASGNHLYNLFLRYTSWNSACKQYSNPWISKHTISSIYQIQPCILVLIVWGTCRWLHLLSWSLSDSKIALCSLCHYSVVIPLKVLLEGILSHLLFGDCLTWHKCAQ